MKKRAGLARAMALDSSLLFFDEPSAGLNPIIGRLSFRQLISSCATEMAKGILIVCELQECWSLWMNPTSSAQCGHWAEN
jgi:phospholipid/cholesterol/gamma-HCH transport system ATP-binding protein